MGDKDRKKVVFLTLIVISIIAIYSNRYLWSPGFLMSGDHAMQYSLLKCYEENNNWLVTGFWCKNLPQWSYNYLYFPPLFFILVLFLDVLFPLTVAYKIVLTVAWFFIPAVVFLLNYKKRYYYSATVSFALLLFLQAGVDFFGFDYLFLYGGMPQTLGWAFFLLTTAKTLDFFKQPTKKNFLQLTVLTSLLVLAHLLIFLFFALFFLIQCIKSFEFTKKNWKKVFSFVLAVFLLTAFWTIPLITKNGLMQKSGALNPAEEVLGYTQITSSAARLGFVTLLLGVIGLLLLLVQKNDLGELTRQITVVLIIALLIGAVPLFRYYFSFYRLSQLLVILLLFGAGFLVQWTREKTHQSGKLIFFAVVLVLMIPFVQQIKDVFESGSLVVTSGDKRFGVSAEEIYARVKKALPPNSGRVLVQDFYGQELVSTKNVTDIFTTTRFWIPLSFVTQNEILSIYRDLKPFRDVAYVSLTVIGSYGSFVREPFPISAPNSLSNMSIAKIRHALDTLNINYVLTSQDSLKQTFAFLPAAWRNTKEGNVVLYNYPVKTEHFVSLQNETVVQETYYDGLKAQARIETPTETTIVFEQPYWPNWIAEVDGAKQEIGLSALGYMTVKVSQGEHKVVFTYRILWYETAGVILILAGLIFLLSSSRTFPRQHAAESLAPEKN